MRMMRATKPNTRAYPWCGFRSFRFLLFFNPDRQRSLIVMDGYMWMVTGCRDTDDNTKADADADSKEEDSK